MTVILNSTPKNGVKCPLSLNQRHASYTHAVVASPRPGASLGLKMWGGQQAEPLKGAWRWSPQRGPGAPGQGFKFPEVESFLVFVQQVSTEKWSSES